SPGSYAVSRATRRARTVVANPGGENFGVFRDYHAALIADAANDSQEALKRIQAAYAADKNTLRLVDAYARFMVRHGDRDEALRAYEAFDQILPNHPIVAAARA